MASLFPAPQQYFDNNGDPLAGGKVYFYEAGTTTPKTTYTDQGGGTPNANPVILDSAGRASIWGSGNYKEVVKTSADVTISTRDTVVLSTVPDDGTITNPKLADMAANTIKGRAASATGVPGDISLTASTFLAREATGNIVASPLSSVRQLPKVSGQWYPPANMIIAPSSSLTLTANQLWALPFYVDTTQTYTRIGVRVNGADAGKAIRLGIYSDSSGVPGALVLDAGTVSTTSTGLQEITISQSLTPGWYWLAFVANTSTATILSGTGSTGSIPMMGVTDPTSYVNNYAAYKTFSYAALPNPFGSLTGYIATGTVPWIGMKI